MFKIECWLNVSYLVMFKAKDNKKEKQKKIRKSLKKKVVGWYTILQSFQETQNQNGPLISETSTSRYQSNSIS